MTRFTGTNILSFDMIVCSGVCDSAVREACRKRCVDCKLEDVNVPSIIRLKDASRKREPRSDACDERPLYPSLSDIHLLNDMYLLPGHRLGQRACTAAQLADFEKPPPLTFGSYFNTAMLPR